MPTRNRGELRSTIKATGTAKATLVLADYRPAVVGKPSNVVAMTARPNSYERRRFDMPNLRGLAAENAALRDTVVELALEIRDLRMGHG